MTPLVQRMAKITPDAHKFMWFDIGHIPYTEVEFTLNGEVLSHMPFECTAVCGTDADGWQFVLTLFGSGDSVAVGGWALGDGQKHLLTPFAFLNQDGGVRLVPSRGAPLPPRDKCLRSLAIIDHFARSLSRPSEAYGAAPEQTFINRVRMKKGKAALSYEWRTVKVEPPAPKTEPRGGTHASPRLHDRRGHWRVRNGRKHWVRACVVGDPDKGVVEKDYRIDHARKAN